MRRFLGAVRELQEVSCAPFHRSITSDITSDILLPHAKSPLAWVQVKSKLCITCPAPALHCLLPLYLYPLYL